MGAGDNVGQTSKAGCMGVWRAARNQSQKVDGSVAYAAECASVEGVRHDARTAAERFRDL